MRPPTSDSTETHAEAATDGTDAPATGANGNGNGASTPPATGRPTVVDTPQVQLDPLAAAGGSPGQRGSLRRQLEKLRRELDKQRSELGTLVVDAKKRSPTSRPKAVDTRAQAVADLEAKVAELAHAVEGDRVRRELRVGIAGTCGDCGKLLATEDRFCPSCGRPTKPGRARPDEAAAFKAAARGEDGPGEAEASGETEMLAAGTDADKTSGAAQPTGAAEATDAADTGVTAEFSAVGDTSENPAISRAALADAPPPTPGTEQPRKKKWRRK